MSYVKNIVPVILCLIYTATAEATLIIVDSAVEVNQNGWLSAGGWHNDGSVVPGTSFSGVPFLTPAVQEGTSAAHMNNTPAVSNADVSGGADTLQAGAYTVYFSMGNYNNAAFPTVLASAIIFAGLSGSAASSSSTVAPAAGDWELWTLTWDVLDGNPNIGNPLSFSLGTTVTGNAAFDGVGGLSGLGSGFLVEVEIASVPLPGTLALLGFGLSGLVLTRRKKA